ncbi:MAG: ATP-binding protein [Christensenellaceae bacterium]|nr:ATP-binding protein [Christensenellaceae bacterium]
MRFYLKLFLCMTIIVTLALSGMGTLLIARDFDNAIAQELESALIKLRFMHITIQIDLARNGREDTFAALSSQSTRFPGQIALCSNRGDILYSNFQSEHMDWRDMLTDFLPGDGDSAHLKKIYENNSYTHVVRAIGTFDFDGETYVLIMEQSVEHVFSALKVQFTSYKIVYLIVLAVSACVLWFVTLWLTRPIKKLSRTSARIADGHFSQRTDIASNDEIGQLGQDFNRMADTVQEKIKVLEQNAEQKDRFIASFAHELKTPLTSVIGYADMLYQRSLDPKTTRMAAAYILDEGMRLESLSLKLMDLFVLDKQEFTFEEISALDLLQNVADTLRPPMNDKQIEITLNADDAYVRIEYDLFKTVLVNLVDNAAKAGARHIALIGKAEAERYRFTIADDGCGMAKEELARITEAFYMVDKSRSRAQHGMGLGLAIASRIAQIHKAELTFESQVGAGTKAHILLKSEVSKSEE